MGPLGVMYFVVATAAAEEFAGEVLVVFTTPSFTAARVGSFFDGCPALKTAAGADDVPVDFNSPIALEIIS